MLIRINKYLASLGISSRRKIDTLIYQSRITVNSHPATPGQKINPQQDQIRLDGKLIKNESPQLEYILLNKPRKVLSTTKDDKGRNTVLKYVNSPNRLYPIGRLDNESTGAIILTNDGDLAHRLTHPKHHIAKTYLVETNSKVSQEQIQKLSQGVVIETKITQPAQVCVHFKNGNKTTLKITIFEGKNRQIRKMFKKLNLKVSSLHRISIGPVMLHHLKLGQTRNLTSIEIAKLKTPMV